MPIGKVLSRAVSAALVAFALTLSSHSIAQDRELAESPDFRVRVQAALRLGHNGGSRSRVELERALHDSHPAVRVACAAALGNIGDAASIAPLDQAMRAETFASVKNAMREAIEKIRGASSSQAAPSVSRASVDKAKWVVQLGNMRNNTGVRAGDLDTIMQRAARAKADSIKGAVIIDSADASVFRRASERKIPVLLVDGSLARLTQSTARDGGVIVSAQVDLSIRRVPQQTLKGTISGKASASDDARALSRNIADLQNKAVGAAVESAMSSVGSEIALLAN